jgi:hypothetical protein
MLDRDRCSVPGIGASPNCDRPDTLARELGRANVGCALDPGASEARLPGRLTAARLPGLLAEAGVGFAAPGPALKPNDSLLADRGGCWLGSPLTLAAALVLALGRFRELRTVTVPGSPDRLWRGDPPAMLRCGGVDGNDGAGSFERAVCTRSSSFCILPMSPRIWCSDRDDDDGGGMPGRSAVPSRELGMRHVLLLATEPGSGGACVRCGAGVEVGMDGPRECRGARSPEGRGVVPGRMDPRVFDGTGVMGPTDFL